MSTQPVLGMANQRLDSAPAPRPDVVLCESLYEQRLPQIQEKCEDDAGRHHDFPFYNFLNPIGPDVVHVDGSRSLHLFLFSFWPPQIIFYPPQRCLSSISVDSTRTTS